MTVKAEVNEQPTLLLSRHKFDRSDVELEREGRSEQLLYPAKGKVVYERDGVGHKVAKRSSELK